MDVSGRTYPQLALDLQLCFPLYAATRAVTKRYVTLLEGTGLTYPQYLVMLVLWEADEPLTVTALGHRLRLDSGTLTPLLKRLEAAGHIRRERDPGDERRVLVSLTEAGRALEEQVSGVPQQLGQSMGISRDEALALRDQLTELVDHLDAADSA
ncbi:MarR family transcriptional regulator [Nocardioides sp. KC13]|uniref:MarR family transcriptional regulator n=1 Tax=Nocardioides turkmenicus TaxID=2711220 RepID=A0A6M1R9A5_9ACTN|nr:MarR family transcriptional regulator [Nocardioides sp. KC13]NGN94079.1 MarR family transcriptional regulator [Nocardioides sp. KC13]